MNNEVKRAKECVRADLYRVMSSYNRKGLIKNVLFNRTFRPVYTLRMCQYFSCKSGVIYRILFLFFRIVHELSCTVASIDLNWKTSIGPGFCLHHGWGVVINERAVIGHNVTILHGVTLGQKDKICENGERTTYYPVVGNNVWIGPNAVVIGEARLGDGSIVAPLSLVHKAVSPKYLVGGNPFKVLKENCIEDVYNKAPDELIFNLQCKR